jgi:hypothetical protein
MARQSDFISATRAVSNRLIDAVNEARALRREWDAMDYGSTLTDDAFAGEHAGLTTANLADFFSAMETVEQFLATGAATNYYRLR